MREINTIEEAEEAMKVTPHMYLVAFSTEGSTGSMIVAAKEEQPYYKIYFMLMGANKEGTKLTVTSIQKLT